MDFSPKWRKPGSDCVFGLRGVTSSPTTPVFLGLLPFAPKLVRKSTGRQKLQGGGPSKMAQVLGQVEENTTARMEPLSQSGSDEWL